VGRPAPATAELLLGEGVHHAQHHQGAAGASSGAWLGLTWLLFFSVFSFHFPWLLLSFLFCFHFFLSFETIRGTLFIFLIIIFFLDRCLFDEEAMVLSKNSKSKWNLPA
jgi:hypothetical protein